MQAPAWVIRNTRTLMMAASKLGIPMMLTEQYPKGLAHIVLEIQGFFGGRPGIGPGTDPGTGKVFEKMHFSCMNEPAFAAEFKSLNRRQAVIVGMEAHICVMQTGSNGPLDGSPSFTQRPVLVTAETTAVVKPGTLAILGLGLVGLGIAWRKRMI